MKTSIAAFVVAVEGSSPGMPRLGDRSPCSSLRTRKVPPWTHVESDRTPEEPGERIDYCLVGEPTCVSRLGDTIKTAGAARSPEH